MRVAWVNTGRGASHVEVNVTDDRKVELIMEHGIEQLTGEEAGQLSRALKAAESIIATVEEQ